MAKRNLCLKSFIPKHCVVDSDKLTSLNEFLEVSKRLLVLTGAGISTQSGIPDYRSETVGLYARTSRRPVQFQEFARSPSARQRYWARNYVGWPQFSSFLPNIAHETLSCWETAGRLHWLVTQNVDALHTKAGSTQLTELHGCTHRIKCLDCNNTMSRWSLQQLFRDHNVNWINDEELELAPDGDVIISDEKVQTFQVVPCPSCNGRLIPDVVFFGDNVARTVVDDVFRKVDESDAILVVGSSLQVYSGYRFVCHAHKQNKPIAIVNIGSTRADKLASLIIDGACGDVLSQANI